MRPEVFLSSPGNQMAAHAVMGMPVLVSFALWSGWMESYLPTFGATVADSGAYSAWNSGKAIDVDAYGQWLEDHGNSFCAAAALDDIAGDWKQSLANWDRLPQTFPVIHDSDPTEYLDEVLARMEDGGRGHLRPMDQQWIGIGLVPPRTNTAWVLETLRKIPSRIHVHLFAMRGLLPEAMSIRHSGLSADSVNWMLDSFAIAKRLPWLTTAECTDIVIKRYKREVLKCRKNSTQSTLFA